MDWIISFAIGAFAILAVLAAIVAVVAMKALDFVFGDDEFCIQRNNVAGGDIAGRGIIKSVRADG